MYADDTAIFCSGKDVSVLESVMNRNLSKLNHWACNNKLTINASKTKYMLFGKRQSGQVPYPTLLIGSNELKHCDQFDYLGVRLDTCLSFKPHIQNVLANCNARLVTLCKIRRYIDCRTATLIYKSIIMSKMQYGMVFVLMPHRVKDKKCSGFKTAPCEFVRWLPGIPLT